MIENILNRIFILLPGSCPRSGTWGAGGGGGGVKNFSAGICNCAPSTSRSSYHMSSMATGSYLMLCIKLHKPLMENLHIQIIFNVVCNFM